MSQDFKVFYVQGLNEQQLNNMIKELKQKYAQVYYHAGKFIGTAEYYGDIYAR